MKRKFIPVEESFARWKKDPQYAAAYESLQEEFVLASAVIKARGEADTTQEQVAEAMGTTQAVIVRLESGKVLSSTCTLERFAKATHTRLRISFERENQTAKLRIKPKIVKLCTRSLEPGSHLAAWCQTGLLEDGLAIAEHNEIWNALHAETSGQFRVALGIDL